MAERLGVSRITVMKAYHQLQNLGWVEVRYGNGVFASLSRGRKDEPPEVSLIDSWAATLGLKVNPWAIALTIEGARIDEVRSVHRRITLRERAWLGQRMRALVRDARRLGLAHNDIDKLLRAATEWDNLSWSCGNKERSADEIAKLIEAVATLQRRHRRKARSDEAPVQT